jgi:hypothetical protein
VLAPGDLGSGQFGLERVDVDDVGRDADEELGAAGDHPRGQPYRQQRQG